MLSSYSSLTLQLLQIKKHQQQKKISAAHITFPYTFVCSMFSPEPLQTDKGRGKQEVCSQEHFVTLYWEDPRKDQSALPSHKANTSDFNQHNESIIQIHGHGQKLLSKPTRVHLFGLLINSKYCFYASCIMPKTGAIPERIVAYAACTICYSLFS